LQVIDIFRFPTVAGQAAWIDRHSDAESVPAEATSAGAERGASRRSARSAGRNRRRAARERKRTP
ncbi:MAG: hypothetical protein AAF725_27855, partial [Acidobacteriota bacterium]